MDYHTTTLAAHQRQVDEQAAHDEAMESLKQEAADRIEECMADLQAVPTVVDGKLGAELPYIVAQDVLFDELGHDDSPVIRALISLIERPEGKELRRLIGRVHAENVAGDVAKLWAKEVH